MTWQFRGTADHFDSRNSVACHSRPSNQGTSNLFQSQMGTQVKYGQQIKSLRTAISIHHKSVMYIKLCNLVWWTISFH